MLGAPAVATWTAQIAFWALLILGVFFGEKGARWAGTYVTLWSIACFGLPRLTDFSGLLVTPAVAVFALVMALDLFYVDNL